MRYSQYQHPQEYPLWRTEPAASFQPTYQAHTLACAEHWTSPQPALTDDAFNPMDCVLRAAFSAPTENPGWSSLLLAQLGDLSQKKS